MVKQREHTLRFAVRKFDPFERAMESLWRRYCKDTGCTMDIEFIPLDLEALHHTLFVEGGLKTGLWDIAHVNTDWIAEGCLSNSFLDLKPFIQKDPPQDFPAGWTSSLLESQMVGDEIIGLPFHDGPECLIFRKDLFEDNQEKEDFFARFGKPLQAPLTWDDFIDVARFFQRPHQNLSGTVFAGYPDGHNAVFDFCLQLWTRGGALTNRDGSVLINTNEAEESLNYYRAILTDNSCIHPGSAEFESVQAGLAFAQGEAAMMINWFGFAAMCEVDAMSQVKGKVAITDIPHGPGGSSVSLNVYWLYTIGAGSRHKDIAYNFIRYAVNAENDRALTEEGGIGCRISTWKNPAINHIIPYYHTLEHLHKQAKTLPLKSNWAQIATIIDQAIQRALHSTDPSAVILHEAQLEITELENTT